MRPRRRPSVARTCLSIPRWARRGNRQALRRAAARRRRPSATLHGAAVARIEAHRGADRARSSARHDGGDAVRGPLCRARTADVDIGELPLFVAGRRVLRCDRQKLPLPRDALELVRSAIVEGEPRPDDEVADRPRNQDLVRPGLGTDSRGDVDGDAADVLAHPLELAGVKRAGAPASPPRRLGPPGAGPPRSRTLSPAGRRPAAPGTAAPRPSRCNRAWTPPPALLPHPAPRAPPARPDRLAAQETAAL